jgi:predicted small metal-binding protein
MMKFECKDLGLDCDFVATAATKDEVKELAMVHAVEAHDDMLKNLTAEQVQEMNEKIEAAIKTDEAKDFVEEDDETEDDEEKTEDEEESAEVA